MMLDANHGAGFSQDRRLHLLTCLVYGWDITSPIMVVGDDGIIIIDPPMEVAR